MRAKYIGLTNGCVTNGKVYDVQAYAGYYQITDDEGDHSSYHRDQFEVIPDESSAEPAATTNVVIDGPGEYVDRMGRLVKIVGKTAEDGSLRRYPEHVWVSDTRLTYRPDGTYDAIAGAETPEDIVRKVVMPSQPETGYDIVRKVVMPSQPETKPSNPKDVIGSTKPPLSCIPTGPLYEVGAAMLDGSAKYGRHNWRVIGVRSSVYYDAALRHLMKWWEGEELDTDSGCHHLAHAVACCLIVRDAANLGQLTDDRPVPGGDPTTGVKELIKQIKERYPEPVPPFLASHK